jgi:hypothetical protein
MLAILAAMAVATAPSATDRPVAKDAVADVAGDARLSVAQAFRTGRFCKGAGRLETSLAEPALLFRPQDREAARARKLIELPPAEACLVDRSPAVGEAGR